MTPTEAADQLAAFSAEIIDYAQGYSMVDPLSVLDLEQLGGAITAWRHRDDDWRIVKLAPWRIERGLVESHQLFTVEAEA